MTLNPESGEPTLKDSINELPSLAALKLKTTCNPALCRSDYSLQPKRIWGCEHTAVKSFNVIKPLFIVLHVSQYGRCRLMETEDKHGCCGQFLIRTLEELSGREMDCYLPASLSSPMISESPNSSSPLSRKSLSRTRQPGSHTAPSSDSTEHKHTQTFLVIICIISQNSLQKTSPKH